VAAADKGLDVKGVAGERSDRGGEVGVVHAVSEVVDGLVVPSVSATWEGSVWTESHVGHWNVGDVVGWVLSGWKATGWSVLASDNVEDGVTTVLTWVSTPDEGTDVWVVLDWGRVDLSTAHLENSHWLAHSSELADNVELSTSPGNGGTVHVLGLDRVVNTAKVDDNVRVVDGAVDWKPVVGSWVTLATWTLGVVDLVAELLSSVERTVKVWSNSSVVTLHLSGGVGPASDESNAGVVWRTLQWEHTLVLEESNTLTSDLSSEVLSVWSVDIGVGEVAVWDTSTVKVSNTDEGGVLTDQSLVECAHVEQTLSVRSWQVVWVVGTTVNVGSGVESGSNSLLAGLGVVVWQENVLDSIAVRGNPLLLGGPVPVLSENSLEKVLVCASGNSVERVVAAHEGTSVGVTSTALE